MADPFIPDYPPFHVEPDGFKVWETKTGFLVRGNTYQTYRGDLKGVARFIEKERGEDVA